MACQEPVHFCNANFDLLATVPSDTPWTELARVFQSSPIYATLRKKTSGDRAELEQTFNNKTDVEQNLNNREKLVEKKLPPEQKIRNVKLISDKPRKETRILLHNSLSDVKQNCSRFGTFTEFKGREVKKRFKLEVVEYHFYDCSVPEKQATETRPVAPPKLHLMMQPVAPPVQRMVWLGWMPVSK